MTTTDPRPDQGAALDLAAHRDALRAYLRTTPELAAWRGCPPGTVEDMVVQHAELMSVLAAAGWSRWGWAAEVGGLGGDLRHRALLYDELAAHDLPVPAQYSLLETMGPPLLRYAPALAEQFLPACLEGAEWWGQGFSEPDAGSDMAAVRTRITRDGDSYVVSGQKTWTTLGAGASRLMCLGRTGDAASRHRGLTMLFIDADATGLEIRPIALASGRNETAQMFFDDVRVPSSRRIGAEGEGWAVAMYLLQFERASYAWLMSARLLAQLRLLRDQLSVRDECAARAFAHAYFDVVALRSRSVHTVRRLADDQPVGPEASVDKILLSRAEQSVLDAARDLLSPALEFGSGPDVDNWRSEWWYSRAATILGGSVEIQRTILADHVLGLPKG